MVSCSHTMINCGKMSEWIKHVFWKGGTLGLGHTVLQVTSWEGHTQSDKIRALQPNQGHSSLPIQTINLAKTVDYFFQQLSIYPAVCPLCEILHCYCYLVLLQPPNFHRHRGGWLTSNQYCHHSVIGSFSGCCFLKTAPHYSAELQ